MEFIYQQKINKERIAILIGRNGEIKKEIEKSTNTKIEVDSKEGDILIRGEDGLGLFTASEVIKAIGRGFNPEISLLLLKPEYLLEIIDIMNYCGKSKKKLIRIKGRIIGKEGKSRQHIEEITETNISVYGKTVAILGEINNLQLARESIISLVNGTPHSKVYGWLEKKRRAKKFSEIIGEVPEYNL